MCKNLSQKCIKMCKTLIGMVKISSWSLEISFYCILLPNNFGYFWTKCVRIWSRWQNLILLRTRALLSERSSSRHEIFPEPGSFMDCAILIKVTIADRFGVTIIHFFAVPYNQWCHMCDMLCSRTPSSLSLTFQSNVSWQGGDLPLL